MIMMIYSARTLRNFRDTPSRGTMAWEKTDSESESEAASEYRFSKGFWMGDSSYGGPGGVRVMRRICFGGTPASAWSFALNSPTVLSSSTVTVRAGRGSPWHYRRLQDGWSRRRA